MVKLKLLPRNLRWISYTLLLLGTCSLALKILDLLDFEMLSHIALFLVNMGLLSLFVTEQKREDEKLIPMRWNAAIYGVWFGVMYGFGNKLLVGLGWSDLQTTDESILFVVLLGMNLTLWADGEAIKIKEMKLSMKNSEQSAK